MTCSRSIPTSLAAHKDDWEKVVAIYYKCVDYLMDPDDEG